MVAPGLRGVQRSATICKAVRRRFSCDPDAPIFRSKFSTALGIEAQGFCMLKQ
jgi:hypothetical protein